MLKIQFSGLSIGHHQFNFQIDKPTFEKMLEGTPLQEDFSNCNVDVNIDLEKTERFLKLNFQFLGAYSVPCDRCLDPVKVPINHNETLIVNFGNDPRSDDHVWEISPKEHTLNLTVFIYETLVLLRPLSNLHSLEDCNPEMLAKLNIQTDQPASIDQRWDALKKLKK